MLRPRLLLSFPFFLLAVCLYAQKKLVFTPQWLPQAQFAGYYAALDRGFYSQAGIEVEIVHPSSSSPTFKLLQEGKCDIITQQLTQAMIKIDNGARLVNILQTSQQNALVVVARTNDIQSMADLKGKKIGVWKVGFGDLAYIVDKDKQMGVKWIPFLQGTNLFISGAVDATLGMSYNEYLQIKLSGHEDKPVFRFADTEYDFPEDGLYVNESFYMNNRKQADAFAKASRLGWEWVRMHPEEALDIVMKWMKKENVHTSRIFQKWMLEEILNLQCEKGSRKAHFELNRQKVERLNSLLLKHGYIQNPVTYERLTGGSQ